MLGKKLQFKQAILEFSAHPLRRKLQTLQRQASRWAKQQAGLHEPIPTSNENPPEICFEHASCWAVELCQACLSRTFAAYSCHRRRFGTRDDDGNFLPELDASNAEFDPS